MKRHFIYAIIAAVFCALISVSCEKDPADGTGSDPDLTPEQQFWAVVGQLVSVNDMTPDYKGKTFQPIIGSELEPGVRVVSVNSLEAAVRKYNTLTGASIDTLKASHTYSSKEVGTLTWNKSTDNKSWGTVDVSIQAVPSLSKIIYRSPEQGDTNGGVTNGGSAYYRFGDVVKRYQDGSVVEYWICVRPAFDPEGKGESHWITVSPLPEENIWPYYETHKPFTASNGFEYGLPYNIREDTEWYQDLAEMLFAICYPDEWVSNIGSYSSTNMFGSPKGLPIFNDFHCTNIKYHNANFWKNVQQQWKAKDIVKKVFGITYEQMADAVRQPTGNQPAGDGLRFLYNGYSWWTKTSNKAQLWQIHYSNQGTKDVQKNMHYALPTKPSAQLVTPNNKTESDKNFPLDVNDVSVKEPFIREPRFFGDNAPRWIIRYATGEELAQNGKWNNQVAMFGFDDKDEEYRYYRDVLNKNLSEKPEETTTFEAIVNNRADQKISDFDGVGHYTFGDVLRDENGKFWFVIRPSGGSADLNPYTDKSPYAEIVSLEGITFSSNKQTATNIVTKAQLMRYSFGLWFLAQEVNKKWTQINNGSKPYILPVYNNIKENADVDLHQLLQALTVTGYHTNDTQGTDLCAFAYYQPGAEKQPLYRYIIDTGTGNAFILIAYDHYTKNNILTNTYPDIKANDFSSTPIYLQDVADAQKVAAYADDYMAKAPFSGVNQARAKRQETDDRALDVTNYFYNRYKWDAGLQPVGMWNEPVIFMRATALYDRGNEYATTTVDGQKMTFVSAGGFESDAYDPQMWFSPAFMYQQAGDRFVDGVNSAIPTWRTIWGN